MTDILTLAKPDALVSSEGAGSNLRAHLSFPSAERLAEFLPAAAELGAAIIPGPPRKLPPSFSPASIAFVDFKLQKEVLEFSAADQVITVQAGMSLGQLDDLLAGSGLWWPVSAANREASLGEVISSAEGGCLEQGFGGPRDLVLGMQVALPCGDVIKCGGKVVKNVTGYDLSKLFIGSRSTLGLVCAAHLRLYSRPPASRTWLFMADDKRQLLESAGKLLGSGLPLPVLELLDSRLIGLFAKEEKALQELAKTASRRSFAMLLQVNGRDDFLAEMVSRMADLLSVSASGLAEVPEQQAQRLVAKLSGSNSLSVQVALPFTAFDALLGDDGAGANCLWQARPGRGRLNLHFENADAKRGFLERSEDWTKRTGHTAVLAFCDEEKEYRVVRHPNDALADSLKAALKARYDPKGCLNPLACV